MERFN